MQLFWQEMENCNLLWKIIAIFVNVVENFCKTKCTMKNDIYNFLLFMFYLPSKGFFFASSNLKHFRAQIFLIFLNVDKTRIASKIISQSVYPQRIILPIFLSVLIWTYLQLLECGDVWNPVLDKCCWCGGV